MCLYLLLQFYWTVEQRGRVHNKLMHTEAVSRRLTQKLPYVCNVHVLLDNLNGSMQGQ